MTNALGSRQASPSNAPVAMQAQTDALLTKAKLIAGAPSDMLPKHYRNNPGACLMAVDWADRNDVSIFEALGEVAFVHGKPVVTAVLQKKLAARSGYRTQLIASTETEATVAVIGPDEIEVGGEGKGRTTYTLDMAKALGIFKGQVWNADPAHMLVKRATTRALEYFGPSELAPLMVEVDDKSSDEIEAPAQENATSAAPAPEPETSEPEQGVIDGDIPTADELKAALKAKGLNQADGLRAVADMDHKDLATLARVANNADAAFDLQDWINQQP